MTETIVHVTTLEQWKSVLDVWFKQGYKWSNGDTGYNYFEDFDEDSGHSYLALEREAIFYSRHKMGSPIEYSEFMAQQKEDNKMETYYVTQGKLNVIEKLKSMSFPLYQLLNEDEFHSLSRSLDDNTEKALLRYIGGDETVEFKVKEPLYRLCRVDDEGNKVYMIFTSLGNPDWSIHEYLAFTATLDEIKKWQTPAWEIEKVD